MNSALGIKIVPIRGYIINEQYRREKPVKAAVRDKTVAISVKHEYFCHNNLPATRRITASKGGIFQKA
ncbi:hypothetical protein [Agrobacterium sp.]|uniref:hypothetical protein n=1 Tax=Agrobacterium sp. TaxID=361 RepID=UPI0028A9CBBF|nr:hypothetical protein [Agrobacterium sp.]